MPRIRFHCDTMLGQRPEGAGHAIRTLTEADFSAGHDDPGVVSTRKRTSESVNSSARKQTRSDCGVPLYSGGRSAQQPLVAPGEPSATVSVTLSGCREKMTRTCPSVKGSDDAANPPDNWIAHERAIFAGRMASGLRENASSSQGQTRCPTIQDSPADKPRIAWEGRKVRRGMIFPPHRAGTQVEQDSARPARAASDMTVALWRPTTKARHITTIQWRKL